MTASTIILQPEKPELNDSLPGRADTEVSNYEAAVLYILGYGFDSVNSARIGLDQVRTTEKPLGRMRYVMFTNYEDMNTVNKRAGISTIPSFRSRKRSVEFACLVYGFGKRDH